LAFRTAVGVNFLASFLGYSVLDPAHGNVDYNTISFDFGAAADIGLRYRIGRTVYLSAGSIFAANFARWMWMDANFTTVSSQKSSTGWEQGFFSFGIRPYITIGFDLVYIW